MIIETLIVLFDRDLTRLSKEIEGYQNESDLWKLGGSIANAAGNLCLHIVGNLNTYIGAELGQSGYVRNRVLEFSAKNVPQKELLEMVERTRIMIQETLSNLTEEELEAEYPVLVFEAPTSTGYFLIHLSTHLAYHLGQINYHRRLLGGLEG